MAKKIDLTEQKAKNSPQGGVLVGKKDGQTIIYDDGKVGGWFVGKTHKEGGIQGIDKTSGQPIEVQTGEVIITAPALADQSKREFQGKMMTNREILSKINSDAGGVAFAEDGMEVSSKVLCKGGQYNYGGKMMSDKDIIDEINKCGCDHDESKFEGGGNIMSKKEKQEVINSRNSIYDEIPQFKLSNDGKNVLKLDARTNRYKTYDSFDSFFDDIERIKMQSISSKNSKKVFDYLEKNGAELYNKSIYGSRYYDYKGKNIRVSNHYNQSELTDDYGIKKHKEIKSFFSNKEDGWKEMINQIENFVNNENFENDGHLSEGMSLEDIAKLHNVSLDSLDEQVKLGMKDESIHAGNYKDHFNIVKDHLVESPTFYTNEQKAQGEFKKGGQVKENLVKDAKDGNTPARDLNNYNDMLDVQADGKVGGDSGIDMDGTGGADASGGVGVFAGGGGVEGFNVKREYYNLSLKELIKRKTLGDNFRENKDYKKIYSDFYDLQKIIWNNKSELTDTLKTEKKLKSLLFNPILIKKVMRDNNIKASVNTANRVRGASSRSQGYNIQENLVNGFIDFYNIDPETLNKLAKSLEKSGFKVLDIYEPIKNNDFGNYMPSSITLSPFYNSEEIMELYNTGLFAGGGKIDDFSDLLSPEFIEMPINTSVQDLINRYDEEAGLSGMIVKFKLGNKNIIAQRKFTYIGGGGKMFQIKTKYIHIDWVDDFNKKYPKYYKSWKETNKGIIQTTYPKYADGGLIAPNGKTSNLTPEQYKLVRTPEFKAWFGDWENDPDNSSKVVDDNGEPLVVYHGTYVENPFYIFDFDKADLGFHFGTYEQAKNRSETKLFFKGRKSIVNSFFLNIKTIFESTDIGEWEYPQRYIDMFVSDGLISESDAKKNGFYRLVQREENKQIREYLLNKYGKFGGFVYNNKYEGKGNSFIVLNPNQIKLADGTNTTFDSENDDIRFAKGGLVVNSIKEIPNFEERLNQRRITYRGLGTGKLSDDFYDLAGESGTIINVDGKDYFITDSEFNTFSRDKDGNLIVKFQAPARKHEDGGDLSFLDDVEKHFDGGGETELPKITSVKISSVGSPTYYGDFVGKVFNNYIELVESLKDIFIEKEKRTSYFYFTINDTKDRFGIQFKNGKNTVLNFNPLTGNYTDFQKQILRRNPTSSKKFDWNDFFGNKNTSNTQPNQPQAPTGKGIDLKGKKIWVEGNPDLSRRVQELAFANGFKFDNDNPTTPQDLKTNALFLFNDLEIVSAGVGKQYFYENSFKEITEADLFGTASATPTSTKKDVIKKLEIVFNFKTEAPNNLDVMDGVEFATMLRKEFGYGSIKADISIFNQDNEFLKTYGLGLTETPSTDWQVNPNLETRGTLKERFTKEYPQYDWEEFFSVDEKQNSQAETKKETKPDLSTRNFAIERKFLTNKINDLAKELEMKRPILSNEEVGFYQREINATIKRLRLVNDDQMSLKPMSERIDSIYSVKWGDYDKQYPETELKSINGAKSELTEEEYLAVRTDGFKSFFGDWELAYETGVYAGVSKIINPKTKEPQPVFHGTNVLFTDWKVYETNNLHYFAVKREMSEFFAKSWEQRSDKAGVDSKALKQLNPNKGKFLYRCFLDIRNPIDLSRFGVEKRPVREFLTYLKINYNIGDYDFWTRLANQNGFTQETKVFAWQIIRNWQSFTKYVKTFTTYDGYIFYEYIPDSSQNGIDDASLSFCAFESNQIKFNNAVEFNALSNDSRFDLGGNI